MTLNSYLKNLYGRGFLPHILFGMLLSFLTAVAQYAVTQHLGVMIDAAGNRPEEILSHFSLMAAFLACYLAENAAFTLFSGTDSQILSCADQPPERIPVYRVQGLSLSYEDSPVLRNLSFQIHEGEKVAIVGTSGGGKTTLFKHIAFSPEHSDLFCTSVYENILFGNPDATREAVYRAAERAAVTDPETFLGREAGTAGELLSEGQRQRVSIARALLRDAPIFLLLSVDEFIL